MGTTMPKGHLTTGLEKLGEKSREVQETGKDNKMMNLFNEKKMDNNSREEFERRERLYCDIYNDDLFV